MGTLYVDEVLPSSTQYLKVGQGSRKLPLYAREVGELCTFRNKRSTSLDFPYYLLSNPDGVISASTYPDYVEYLRSVSLQVPTFEVPGVTATVSNSTTLTLSGAYVVPVGSLLYFQTGAASYQLRTVVASASSTSYTLDESTTVSGGSSFWVLSTTNSTENVSGTWSSSTEFTLTNNPSNRLLFDALIEDALYGGCTFSTVSSVTTYVPENTSFYTTNGFAVLRSNSVDAVVTSLKLNTSTGARSVTVSAPQSTSPTSVVFYPYRLASATDARHKQVLDSTLVNGGIEVISGLRSRDRMQGHWHQLFRSTGFASGTTFLNPDSIGGSEGGIAQNIISDRLNGTPRVGQFTRPRGLGCFFYEYVGTVVS